MTLAKLRNSCQKLARELKLRITRIDTHKIKQDKMSERWLADKDRYK